MSLQSVVRMLSATSILIGGAAFGHGGLIQMEEVSVTGHRHNMLGEAVSASQGKIGQEDIEIRALSRTGDVLETVPGMVATQHSGSGKANQYFLRGFNLDHGTDFATGVDFMPVNMRSHAHGQGYTDLNFIIPELVKSIDYQKGSYTTTSGDFAGTGSASILTASRLDEGTLKLGAGGNGYTRLYTGDSRELQQGDFLYGLELQTYDGPWDDIDEDVDKANLWLKQSWSQGNDYADISLMAYDNEWNSADQIPQRAVTQGIISELGSLDTTVGGKSSRYSLSGYWHRTGPQHILRAAAYVIDYDLDLWSNFTYFTNPDGRGDQFQQTDRRRIYGWDLVYAKYDFWGDMPVTNTFGHQFRYDDIERLGLFRTQARQRLDVTRLDAVDEWSASVYWENQLNWTDKLRSVLGVRYDYFDFDVNPIDAADPATLTANAGQVNDDVVSTSLSLVYAANTSLELYASAGQGFHSNDARGVTLTRDPVTGASAEPADPLVDTFGGELGLRVFLNDRLNASLALWRLDIDSELLFVGDEGVTEDTGIGSRREGVEITGYYSVNDAWTLDLEYAYTDTRLNAPVNGSDDIPGALRTVVSAGANARFDNGFFGNLRLRRFGDYPLDSGETAAGSTLVNLRCGHHWNRWSLTLDVLNLLDSDDHDIEYFYESQLQGEPAPVADRHFHVFEPRTFRLYADFVF